MIYAAVDIGTNSCRLMTADIQGQHMRILQRKLNTTRIGQDVQASGMLQPEPVERTLACLEEYQAFLDAQQIPLSRIVATSAVRDAGNRQWFLDLASDRIGRRVEAIDGEEEARLTYLGVREGLLLQQTPLVVDVGGGSTEFICSNTDFFMQSLPLGAVRAAESKMTSDEILAMLELIAQASDRFTQHPLVCTGGSATNLVAIKLGLKDYQPQRVHGQVLTLAEMQEIYSRLEPMSPDQRRLVPGIHPPRADIIPAGTKILLNILTVLEKCQCIVSESDLLEGILWNLAGKPV